MEQKLGILSSLVQPELSGMSWAGATPDREQGVASQQLFDGMVASASMKAAMQPESQARKEVQNHMEKLRQQITALSEKTQKQLAVAVEEGDTSKAVEDIVAGAVSQLWGILADFDAKNGTTLIQDFSENLVQVEADPEGLQLTSMIFQSTAGAVLQEGGATQSGQAFGIDPTQSALPLNVAEGSAGLNGSRMERPQIEQSPLMNGLKTEAAPGGKLTIFEQVLKSLKHSESSFAGGSQQAALAAEKSVPTQSARRNFALLPNMQQLATVLSTTGPTVTNSGASTQSVLALANGDKPALTGLVAGIDINARVKILLLATAKENLSRGVSLTGVAEAGNTLPNALADTQMAGPVAKPEQVPVSSGFSKSIASQIQGKVLNPGRTRIELAPRGLGSLVIDLQSKDTGGLQVLVRVENPVVLNALRTDRNALLAVLANAEVSPEDISLDFQGFSQREFGQDEENQGALQMSGSLAEAESQTEIEPSHVNRPMLGAGQLDFFT